MTQEALFAGFGGQGVLTMGQILAYSGMYEGKEVCWMPSYGPEMRGGTANCITIVSDSEISSPIISMFDTVVALNQPSVDKFESKVKVGGNIIYDASNILNAPTRTDINIIAVNGSEEAVKLQNTRVLNMIMLGAFLKATNAVTIESIHGTLEKVFDGGKKKLIPLNIKALEVGMSYVK